MPAMPLPTPVPARVPVLALTMSAALPAEGVFRTTAAIDKRGHEIQVMWKRSESTFASVRERAEEMASARDGARILGTEIFRRGRWRVVAMGDNVPA